MRRFQNKVAFVTGASRGIGKTIAERFASEGAKVALISNSNEDLNETEQQFKALGYEVLPILADVSNAEQIERAVESTVAQWGRIDILANNAGIAWEEDFLEIKDENWRKMLDVNLNGMYYNASKGGITLLTMTMALELGKHNIRVNAVCPGYIQTPMAEAIDDAAFIEEYIRTKIPLGRVGKPQDVSGIFAFLASEDASFITGTTIVVDGGQLAQ
jgi:3-oxoacyl-[acyl-carrier protein] reductase